MGDEFEDRENGLGELPGDLARMRDYESQFLKVPPDASMGGTPGGIPFDVINQSRVAGVPGKGGSVPSPVKVNSVYDARPINARDFYVQDEQLFNFEAGGEEAVNTVRSFSFPIPNAYIGVLRGFQYSLLNPMMMTAQNASVPADIVRITTTLFLNGSPLPNYQNLKLRNGGELIPCYFPIETGGIIKIETTFQDSMIITGEPSQIITFTLYGNLLLSRGLPANFEPGS